MGGLLAPKSLALATNWVNYQEKASFSLLPTKICRANLSKRWANFVTYSLRGNTDQCTLVFKVGKIHQLSFYNFGNLCGQLKDNI